MVFFYVVENKGSRVAGSHFGGLNLPIRAHRKVRRKCQKASQWPGSVCFQSVTRDRSRDLVSRLDSLGIGTAQKAKNQTNRGGNDDMSHGMEMDETNARKQQAPGSSAERALDLVVDLVRSREHYRDELIAQNAAYCKVCEERDRWKQAADKCDRQGMLIEWFRLLLLEAGVGFCGGRLLPEGQAKLIREALSGKPWDESQDPDDLDDAIERWMQREAKARGIDLEREG